MIETMNLAILISAGLVAISIATSLVSFRIGAPLLLVFLGVGLLAGEDGLGQIDFDNGAIAYFIGSLALAIILFDSGFETKLQSYRVAAGPALTLATFGVVITAGLLGVAAHLLFDLPLIQAFLLGAIIGSTDAAAVFFLLRVGGVTLKDRVKATLEIESGTNDPMAVFLTLTLVELAAAGTTWETLGWAVAGDFLLQLGVGLAAGAAGGYGLAWALGRLKLEPGLYPITALSLALVIFAATGMLGGSGFLAVYVAGLVAGNVGLSIAPQLRRFQSGMTWLAQIAMFLTLGLLATPSQFAHVAVPGIILAVLLILVARPLAVWICLLPFGFSRNEITFVAWVGLRGAVSILLAILPTIGGLPNGQMFFNLVFVMVVASLAVQGWTIRAMARWLGLIVPPRIGPVDRVELDLPGAANQELVAYRIAPDSAVAMGDRIPRWARPSLIVRGDRTYTIHSAGPLQPGDYVYLFTNPRRVNLLDKLFAVPVAAEDRDFYGDFPLPADAALESVAASYGFEPPEAWRSFTVGELLTREHAGRPEVGDRLMVGPVELIVRAMNDEAQVAEVGLALEPSRAAQPRLPLFLTHRDLRRAWQRRRQRRAKTA